MSAIPPISNSNSLSSKTLTRSGGINSLKPVTKALNCSSTRFCIRHSVISLQQSQSNTSIVMQTHTQRILFVLVGDFDIATIGLEIDGLDLSKTFVLCRKCRLNHSFNIIFPIRVNWAIRHEIQMFLTWSRSTFGGNQHQPLPCPLVTPSFEGSSCRKLQ